MKKSVIVAAILTLFVATGARAEHADVETGHAESHQRLLVTDVPDPGEVEVRVDYFYSRALGRDALDNKIKIEDNTGVASLGVGIARGLKLSASLPYEIVKHEDSSRSEGWGNLVLGARFAPTRGLVQFPVDFAVGIDWQLNTASEEPGKPGKAGNIYSPYLALSKELGMAIPYLKYQPDVIVNGAKDQTNHNVILGAEIECAPTFTLDASVKVSAIGSSIETKNRTDVEFELMPYINIAKNTYLLPRVAYKLAGDVKDSNNGIISRDLQEFKAGLGFYFLF